MILFEWGPVLPSPFFSFTATASPFSSFHLPSSLPSLSNLLPPSSSQFSFISTCFLSPPHAVHTYLYLPTYPFRRHRPCLPPVYVAINSSVDKPPTRLETRSSPVL